MGTFRLLDDETPSTVKAKGKFRLLEDDSASGVNWEAAKDTLVDTAKNISAGALKGASNIGATLMRPIDYLTDKISGADSQTIGGLISGQKPRTTSEERRAKLADFFKENADPESLAFKGGELGAEIAGTAGVGGLLAKSAGAVGAAPKVVSALETGGLRLGGPAATTAAGKAREAALRVGAGGAVGGASAGLIDPASAPAGAAIGGVLPMAVKAAGAAGGALAGKVAPEVKALYEKAKSLGIDIPADRIVNSRPLNAVASSLNYVPLSGRAGTEERMVSQLNRAVSKTFGQDSDNVTAALRKAGTALGDKFEVTLKSNTVKADAQLLDDLAEHINRANKELGADGVRIIKNMADEIMGKVNAAGEIDGQAAYNIKKALDRVGNRNAPEAYYARDLKKSLMGALDRSLGPDKAAEFAKVRQQYGNMLDMESIAQNGGKGGVSIGRLANMKNINNAELQELADIAAQFVKTREGPHGAAQRVFLGGAGTVGAAATGSLPLLGAGVAAGRLTNTALNSNTLKSLLMNPGTVSGGIERLESPALRALLYNGANRQGGNSP